MKQEGKGRGEFALGPPTLEQFPVNQIEIEDFPYGLVHQIINGPWLTIECGNRWKNDRACVACPNHQFKMSLVERRFSYREHQPPSFLQHNVGGACQQIVVVRIGNTGERLYGTGGDDHAVTLE